MEGYCQATCGVCSTSTEPDSPSAAPAPTPGVKQQLTRASAALALAGTALTDPVPLIGYPVPVPPAVAPSTPATELPAPKFKLPCTDEAPPSKHKYSCLQQAILWRKVPSQRYTQPLLQHYTFTETTSHGCSRTVRTTVSSWK